MGYKNKKQMIHLVGQVVIAKHVDGSEYQGILHRATDEGIYIIPVNGSQNASDFAHADHGTPEDLELSQAGIFCCFLPLVLIASVFCFRPKPFCEPRPFCGINQGPFF